MGEADFVVGRHVETNAIVKKIDILRSKYSSLKHELIPPGKTFLDSKLTKAQAAEVSTIITIQQDLDRLKDEILHL